MIAQGHKTGGTHALRESANRKPVHGQPLKRHFGVPPSTDYPVQACVLSLVTGSPVNGSNHSCILVHSSFSFHHGCGGQTSSILSQGWTNGLIAVSIPEPPLEAGVLVGQKVPGKHAFRGTAPCLSACPCRRECLRPWGRGTSSRSAPAPPWSRCRGASGRCIPSI